MSSTQLHTQFGQRLRLLRRSLGCTQGWLAESSGISEEYLSKMERGLASPSFEVITRVSRALGTTPMELFGYRPPLRDGEDPLGVLLVADSALAAVFGPMPMGFFVSTQSGRFRLVSDSMARLFGYATGEEMARRIKDIARELYQYPEDRERILSLVSQNGGVLEQDCILMRQDRRPLGVRLFLRRCKSPKRDDTTPCFAGCLMSLNALDGLGGQDGTDSRPTTT